MQIPLNTFYLLWILYLEAEKKDRGECCSIGDFAFGALLSSVVDRCDWESLADDKKGCLKRYRSVLLAAKIVPPRFIANREFVLEEYLALRENAVLIPIETDFTDERVSFNAASFSALHNELEALLLPTLRLSDKRAREGVPDNYFSD